MIYPRNIEGPRFDQGDLVTFVFDEAELTLRLPIIPNNRHNADRVSALKDFRSVSTSDWDTNDQDRPCIELATQRWCFEDANSLDDIAQCELYVGLVEVTDLHRSQNTLLSSYEFEKLMVAWHHYSFGEQHDAMYDHDKNWPVLANRYHGRAVFRDHLDWFVVQLSVNSSERPIRVAMIPLNNRFVLMIFIEIESLHYAGRTNPYSNDLLKQFEADLFDDFLSHIDIKYSPELIEKIQSLKTKTPA